MLWQGEKPGKTKAHTFRMIDYMLFYCEKMKWVKEFNEWKENEKG